MEFRQEIKVGLGRTRPDIARVDVLRTHGLDEEKVLVMLLGPMGGVHGVVSLSNSEARELADALLKSFGEEVIFSWTERDVAVEYANVKCPDCQEGTCEIAEEEHDLAVYYNLPEEERAEIKSRLRKALDYSTVDEATMDVVLSVLERD
jgi:hypothetical protein